MLQELVFITSVKGKLGCNIWLYTSLSMKRIGKIPIDKGPS